MYVEQPWRLSLETTVALRRATQGVDISPGPGGSRITPCGEATAVCRSLLPELGGNWTGCALVALYPTSQIPAHTDPPITGRRYHLPLIVNEGCWSWHDGAWQVLRVGRVYQMDPTQPRGAVNWGAATRLHLIVDTDA